MFDKRLKILRIDRGFTQQEVADALEIPLNTYRNYETNQREPSALTLKRIATFFNVSCDFLLGFEDSQSNTAEVGITDEILDIINDFTHSEKTEVKNYCEYLRYKRDKGD